MTAPAGRRVTRVPATSRMPGTAGACCGSCRGEPAGDGGGLLPAVAAAGEAVAKGGGPAVAAGAPSCVSAAASGVLNAQEGAKAGRGIGSASTGPRAAGGEWALRTWYVAAGCGAVATVAARAIVPAVPAATDAAATWWLARVRSAAARPPAGTIPFAASVAAAARGHSWP
jgi:hypothetical protein